MFMQSLPCLLSASLCINHQCSTSDPPNLRLVDFCPNIWNVKFEILWSRPVKMPESELKEIIEYWKNRNNPSLSPAVKLKRGSEINVWRLKAALCSSSEVRCCRHYKQSSSWINRYKYYTPSVIIFSWPSI